MKNILQWQSMKKQGERISILTCYDAWSAKLISQTDVDAVLVGDSLAQVIHGYDTTVYATIEMMALHTRAVARQITDKFIIGDLPFLTYRKSISEGMQAVESLMQAGAHALKLEGAAGNLDLIRHIVGSGVPVMGHLGLTPQSVHQLGGFRIQGRDAEVAQRLLQDAESLQDAGCFSIVLECIPSELARRVRDTLSIPVIGIGAGVDVDGQVLVLHDLLGLTEGFEAKFVKRYCEGFALFKEAISRFHEEVRGGDFPNKEHSY